MWNQNDFCDPDAGFDYIFTKMNAIYGAAFEHNWRNVDPDIVRQTWKEACGRLLTYRPKMDYALRNMNPDRPPSALAFAKLLLDGPRIPDKPHSMIEHQKTADELAKEKEEREKNIALFKEMSKKLAERMRMS